MSNENVPVITIDGPVASGKGTISRLIALKLGWNLLDSGSLYRLVALSAMQKNIPLDHEELVSDIAFNLDVGFESVDEGEKTNIYLEGKCVNQEIRDEAVGLNASFLANIPQLRKNLLVTQRKFAVLPGLVADGRDMGTVIFPDAKAKIFLTATPESRSKRRYKQLQSSGYSVTISRILFDVQKRDERDKNRLVSPLVPADDSIVVDSSDFGIQEVVNIIYKILRSKKIIPA